MKLTTVRYGFLFLGTLAYLCSGGEILYRFIDGYSFTSVKLEQRKLALPPSQIDDSYVRGLVAETTFEKDISQEWFFSSIPTIKKPRHPELDARLAEDYSGGAGNYIWNDHYLKHPDGSLTDFFKRLKIPEIFAFHSIDASPYPKYRLWPSTQLPFGQTNNFGLLETIDIGLVKPPGTIRIGLTGDSTMSNQIGLFLQSHLNAWAKAKAPELNFEVLNAGRPALDLPDFTKIVKNELGPLGADYVYFYAGSRIPFNELIELPPGMVWGGGYSLEKDRFLIFRQKLNSLPPYSALVRHILGFIDPDTELVEPLKPKVRLLNEQIDKPVLLSEQNNTEKTPSINIPFPEFSQWKGWTGRTRLSQKTNGILEVEGSDDAGSGQIFSPPIEVLKNSDVNITIPIEANYDFQLSAVNEDLNGYVLLPVSNTGTISGNVGSHNRFRIALSSGINIPKNGDRKYLLDTGKIESRVIVNHAGNAESIRYLKAMLQQYDEYKIAAESVGAKPLISTTRIYVRDGMVLRYSVNKVLFETLNGPGYWPLSYRDIRHLLDYHNRTIKAWAEKNKVALVDIDGLVPFRTELTGDGGHDFELGQKLRAWIVFQSLLPLVRQDLETGRIPTQHSRVDGPHIQPNESPLRMNRLEIIANGAQ